MRLLCLLLLLAFRSPAQILTPLDYDALASRIVSALKLRPGERVLLGADPDGYFHGIVPPLQRLLRDSMVQTLDQADVYLAPPPQGRHRRRAPGPDPVDRPGRPPPPDPLSLGRRQRPPRRPPRRPLPRAGPDLPIRPRHRLRRPLRRPGPRHPEAPLRPGPGPHPRRHRPPLPRRRPSLQQAGRRRLRRARPSRPRPRRPRYRASRRRPPRSAARRHRHRPHRRPRGPRRRPNRPRHHLRDSEGPRHPSHRPRESSGRRSLPQRRWRSRPPLPRVRSGLQSQTPRLSLLRLRQGRRAAEPRRQPRARWLRPRRLRPLVLLPRRHCGGGRQACRSIRVWLLLLVLAILLVGALQAAWQGRDQPPPASSATFRVPTREGLPGRLSYIAQLLHDCQSQASRRLQLLHQLDGRLKKRASSLACPAKR